MKSLRLNDAIGCAAAALVELCVEVLRGESVVVPAAAAVAIRDEDGNGASRSRLALD